MYGNPLANKESSRDHAPSKALVDFILNFLGKDTQVPIKVVYVDKSATSTAITSAVLNKNAIQFTHFKEPEDALEFLRQDTADNQKCTIDRR